MDVEEVPVFEGGRLVCTQRGADAGDPRAARGPIRLVWRKA